MISPFVGFSGWDERRGDDGISTPSAIYFPDFEALFGPRAHGNAERVCRGDQADLWGAAPHLCESQGLLLARQLQGGHLSLVKTRPITIAEFEFYARNQKKTKLQMPAVCSLPDLPRNCDCLS